MTNEIQGAVATTAEKPKRTRKKKVETVEVTSSATETNESTAVAEPVVAVKAKKATKAAKKVVAKANPNEVAPARKKKYLNNADLMKQIALSREQDKMTDELAKMLFTLCQRYAKHPDYSNIYSYKEDMEAFAMLTVVKVWKSFNPEKSNNPFAYFTQVLRHAFYQYLNHEKRQREVKDNILVDIGELPSFTYMENYREERDADYDGGGFDESDDEEDTEGRLRRPGYEATLPGTVTEINYDFDARTEDLPPMSDLGEANEL